MISRPQGHKTQTLLTQSAQRAQWQAETRDPLVRQNYLTHLFWIVLFTSLPHVNNSPIAFFQKGRGVMRKQDYNEKHILHHRCCLAGLTASNRPVNVFRAKVN